MSSCPRPPAIACGPAGSMSKSTSMSSPSPRSRDDAAALDVVEHVDVEPVTENS